MEITKEITLFFLTSFFLTISYNPAKSQMLSSPSSFSRGGQWHLLHPSIGISAMHMQLLRNNKVVMFDRTDFGRSNLPLPGGQCRVDPNDTYVPIDCTAHSLLYDIASNTFRPLMIQTDTWCSSGSVLADGNLLQTGGFNDGDHVIRTLFPCNDNACDWVEYPGYLAARRWYATNQILPDGRVIIVGGRRQFNYEFYPRSSHRSSSSNSSGIYRLNFLRETMDADENNLYPFLHLLPDGNLFIFANTRSISFDYVRHRVVKEFPPIPDGVPRNYPSTGSSVLLPLHFSLDPLRGVGADVLICGGAPPGAFSLAARGIYEPASTTCGRLRVTDRDPQWVMEVMPIRRVMGDMLLLPTGDVLIVNGAARGTAGWETARVPVTRPVVYRTYGEDNRRFSVMQPSMIPRLYHSSAVLLTDGRVLVGGSNPHRFYNFTGVLYPTELSLEGFSPPYLAPEYTSRRPRIASFREVLRYREVFEVDFTVSEYVRASVVSVTMLAPSFTTHSFAMNQRLVVLRVIGNMHVSSDLYWLKVAGAPSAEIAPPGYYLLFVVHDGIPSPGVWVRIQ